LFNNIQRGEEDSSRHPPWSGRGGRPGEEAQVANGVHVASYRFPIPAKLRFYLIPNYLLGLLAKLFGLTIFREERKTALAILHDWEGEAGLVRRPKWRMVEARLVR
jgi:hypothetical protein